MLKYTIIGPQEKQVNSMQKKIFKPTWNQKHAFFIHTWKMHHIVVKEWTTQSKFCLYFLIGGRRHVIKISGLILIASYSWINGALLPPLVCMPWNQSADKSNPIRQRIANIIWVWYTHLVKLLPSKIAFALEQNCSLCLLLICLCNNIIAMLVIILFTW